MSTLAIQETDLATILTSKQGRGKVDIPHPVVTAHLFIHVGSDIAAYACNEYNILVTT